MNSSEKNYIISEEKQYDSTVNLIYELIKLQNNVCENISMSEMFGDHYVVDKKNFDAIFSKIIDELVNISSSKLSKKQNKNLAAKHIDDTTKKYMYLNECIETLKENFAKNIVK
jgi:hypothetical protein